MKISPCMGCNERHINCHDNCNSYKKYKELKESINKKISIKNEYISYREDIFR